MLNKVLLALVCITSLVSGGRNLELLAEYETDLENTWRNIFIENCMLVDGSYRISISRSVYSEDYSVLRDYWNISVMESETSASVVVEEANPPESCLIESVYSEDSGTMYLAALTMPDDTLWTCMLEGTSDFDNDAQVFTFGNGDLIVYSKPDCFGSSSNLQKISSFGEALWHYALTTSYLLDVPMDMAELSPSVSSIRETPSGDILVTGSVKQWLTDVPCWFACLLDGETGEVLWKNTGTGLGAAALLDGITVNSDCIIAVGSTAEEVRTPDMNYSEWGEEKTFIAFLDSDGNVSDSVIGGSEFADSYTSIIGIGSTLTDNEYFVVGSDSSSNTMTLGKFRFSY